MMRLQWHIQVMPSGRGIVFESHKITSTEVRPSSGTAVYPHMLILHPHAMCCHVWEPKCTSC